ncbi:glucose-6-phosphate isomerase [Rhodococcus qingshengii]
MTVNIDVTRTPLWEKIVDHQQEVAALHLRELFDVDPHRGSDLTISAGDLYVDYSKHRVTRESLKLLLDLARAVGVEDQRDAMFAGARINASEDRPVAHTALRAPRGVAAQVDGHDVLGNVHEVLDRMGDFTDQVRSGAWCGFTGEAIRTVVNIGIGGSDLGPAMAYCALRHYADGPTVRFVSNIDPADLLSALSDLDPATTLFIVVSKTFSTLETMTNAAAARAWLVETLGETAVPLHFVAVSTDIERVQAFGIAAGNTFGFWEWVGGRYSVGSAVGLALMVAIGRDRFAEFLAGFRDIDEHFRTASLESNAPVLLGLLGVWYASFFGADSRAVLPYSNDLMRFPAYLQQLAMESNGKSVRSDGTPVGSGTGEVVWGEPGTNGQHAFHQMLHQGTRLIPVDFLGFSEPTDDLPTLNGEGSMHGVLLANMFAQSKVLAFGKTSAEIETDGVCAGLAPHKAMPGNRPSTTILAPKLTPSSLGQLIALYEHQVFVQGAVWGINSFDQWGVELGKELALALGPELWNRDRAVSTGDSSTDGLINAYRLSRRGCSGEVNDATVRIDS